MAGVRNNSVGVRNNLRVVSARHVARSGKSKRFGKNLFLILLCAGLFSIAAFFAVKGLRQIKAKLVAEIFESDFFRLSSIEVKIAPELRPPYLTPEHFLDYLKIEEGVSMFALDPLRVSTQLQKHPWVKEAQVRRIFPNKVFLSVEIRHPIALISAKSLYYVDAQGEIFKAVNAQESKDFPLISGISPSLFQRHPQSVHQGIVKAVGLLRLIQDRFPVLTAQGEVSEIKLEALFPFDHLEQLGLEQEWDISLVLNPSGTFVRLGGEGYEEKLLRLLKLVQDPQQHVQINMPLVFDLRFAKQIVVQPLTLPPTETI